jgi:hypothetical protein
MGLLPGASPVSWFPHSATLGVSAQSSGDPLAFAPRSTSAVGSAGVEVTDLRTPGAGRARVLASRLSAFELAGRQGCPPHFRRVVLHEIAHHFGISDERLVELNRYRGANARDVLGPVATRSREV